MLITHEKWPRTAQDAEAEQERLAGSVDVSTPLAPFRYIAGLDVAYAIDSSRVAGAVVVLDADTLAVEDMATAVMDVEFPYVSGLLAFREMPALITALGRLSVDPDVLVCDGYGIAHPRRFGLACHLGVLAGKPAMGVAKTAFVGQAAEPGIQRGEAADLVHGGEVVGAVLRTQLSTKPVFVSPGHLITASDATRLALRLATKYRLPETTRLADQLSRRALAGA
ncbi:Deoxyribonuclease V [Catenulispora acidiphila DSM 44928]|uniref:Endonuclease V n=1 Tax=Catenulispora acidiphila (strain DSM 44928 / JCM 14897 / NBRC 102108 / NRRL B-24433 / ID139908) TaxID=479433 RepID=C7QJC7_CATAD|nr:endonuclease V [Catenulispora acidiphila]ACU71150.1 Deoxyribonuclease V [Catenulispora acidiphila DSM 44928]